LPVAARKDPQQPKYCDATTDIATIAKRRNAIIKGIVEHGQTEIRKNSQIVLLINITVKQKFENFIMYIYVSKWEREREKENKTQIEKVWK